MGARKVSFLLYLLLLISAAAGAQPLRIAAASNIAPAVELAAQLYAHQTGAPQPVVSPGASGTLQRQLRQGAPFDLFISADSARVQQLADEGVLLPTTVRPYAQGKLVLAVAPGTGGDLADLAEVLRRHRGRLAIPNPQHAPYGAAAVQVLQLLRLEEEILPNAVFAENVGQAMRYVQTGNVDLAFLPASLALQEQLAHHPIDGALHEPIVQSLGVVDGGNVVEALRFVELFTSTEFLARLLHQGYAPPPSGAAAPPTPAAPRPIDWRPVWLTLHVAAATTGISLVIGTLLGWFLAGHAFPGRRWIMAATMLPLVLPPTVLGFYLLVAFGRTSPLGRAWEAVFGEPLVFTTNAAVLAASVAAVPIVARQMAVAFAGIGHDVLEAGRMDGAGRVRLFWEIQLPLVRPALLAGATIAFARAVGDFGATLMIAGNIPGETQTAAIAIYELMNAGREREALYLVLAITVVSAVVLAYLAGQEKEKTAG